VVFGQVGRNVNSIRNRKFNGSSYELFNLFAPTDSKKMLFVEDVPWKHTVNHTPTHFLFSGQSQVSWYSPLIQQHGRVWVHPLH